MISDRDHAIDQSATEPGLNNLGFTTFLFRLPARSAAGTPTTTTANNVVGYESEE